MFHWPELVMAGKGETGRRTKKGDVPEVLLDHLSINRRGIQNDLYVQIKTAWAAAYPKRVNSRRISQKL